MHIIERMQAALNGLAFRFPNRGPKAFYLGPDDWADFVMTNPPTINSVWNGQPAMELAYDDVPVRRSQNVAGRSSKLYCAAGVGRQLDAWGGPVREAFVRRSAERKVRPRTDNLSGPELVEALGDGGFLTWQSSPHVMWLGWRMKKEEPVKAPPVVQ
jgi:hypothetical protein